MGLEPTQSTLLEPTRLVRAVRCPGFGAFVSMLLVPIAIFGCGSPPPPPAAASNEMFDGGVVSTDHRDGASPIDDRWASIVLDGEQASAVRSTFRELVPGPVDPLEPALHGIRFDDVPRAMITAAPRIETAVLRSAFEPARVSASYLDVRGRRATASISLRMRGPVASVDYRVPGDDVAAVRSSQLVDLEKRLVDSTWRSDAELTVDGAEAILRASIRANRGRIDSIDLDPEQYRYTLLMLDEQEMDVVVRREPAPKVLSWSVDVGLFGDRDAAKSFGVVFEDALRAWGATPEPSESRDPMDGRG